LCTRTIYCRGWLGYKEQWIWLDHFLQFNDLILKHRCSSCIRLQRYQLICKSLKFIASRKWQGCFTSTIAHKNSCPVLSFLSHPSPEPTFRDEDDEVDRSLNIYIMLPQLNWFSLLIWGFLSLAFFWSQSLGIRDFASQRSFPLRFYN